MGTRIRIFPYSTQIAAIIEAPEDHYFPSMIRHHERDNSTQTIPQLAAACVFQDHSLITLEKGIRHLQVKEYDIKHGGSHSFGKTPKTAVVLHESKLKKGTQMSMTATESNGVVTILICSDKGEMEKLEFTPRSNSVYSNG